MKLLWGQQWSMDPSVGQLIKKRENKNESYKN